jgi:hypothetical protein
MLANTLVFVKGMNTLVLVGLATPGELKHECIVTFLKPEQASILAGPFALAVLFAPVDLIASNGSRNLHGPTGHQCRASWLL